MILAVCARSGHGTTPDDRERAIDEAVARAKRYARWAFPATDLPSPTIRRFASTALITWSNEPPEWTLANPGNETRASVDGVGYVAPEYRASVAAETRDLLGYSTSLGGCFNLFRATDNAIEAVTDATKSNSVYVGGNGRVRVLSSRALLAHMVTSARTRPAFDLRALATMPSRGYLLGDGSPYEGVSLLGVAEQVLVTPDGEKRSTAVPDSIGNPMSDQRLWSEVVDATAEALVHAFDPLVGGDLHLALTGGRDSRIIAAALSHHESISPTTHTMGTPSEPDVVLAAEIAAICGWTHHVNPPSRISASGHSMLVEDPIDRITRVLDVHDGMNSAWDDVQDYGPVNNMPIMSGVGGEILRGGLVLTAHTELTRELATRELHAALGADPLVSIIEEEPYGRRYLDMVQTSPHRAADEFYYHERNGRWVASRRMGARFRRRVVDPLLDNRFVRNTRQIDPEIRWSERLAFDVIRHLNPRLRDLALEGNRWRFERGRPHRDYPAGWESRTALVRDQLSSAYHWKNLDDEGMRRRIDALILDGLQSGPASDLLNSDRVQQFLAAAPARASKRWHLATAAVMLTENWWMTGREPVNESITLRLPEGEADAIAAEDTANAATEAPPAISVIIPMHNAERYIRETLESIAAQSMTDFEVLVVDDGSMDNSATIVDEFAARDQRFRRLACTGTGSAGAARNIGLAAARGEYLAFLDADDLFAPSMLEKLYVKAKSESADVIITGFRTFHDVTGEEAPQKWAMRLEYLPKITPFAPSDIADHIFYITNPANWNKLFRREHVIDNNIRFQHLARSNDAYFTFISLAKASRISYVNEELVKYRIGNAGSLQGSIDQTPLDFAAALEEISDSLAKGALSTTYKTAFINLVATMSMGALARTNSADAFIATYDKVRDDLFPKFGVTNAAAGTFLTSYIRRNVSTIVDKTVAQWLFDRDAPVRTPAVGTKKLEASDEPLTSEEFAGTMSQPGIESSQRGRPDVSVIVPVHNSGRWLHECLLSILGQTQVSLEVICVNDGSTDDSLRILNEYATSDPRVVVLNRANGGQSAARNDGLAAASGRYIIFVDSDDYWRTDSLSSLVARADRDNLDVLLFDAESFFEPGISEKTYQSYATYYERERSFSTPTTGVRLASTLIRASGYRASPCLYLTRTELLAEAQLRFIPGIVHEDNPYTFTVLLKAQRAAHEKLAFYARRVRPGSTMTQGSSERSMHGYFVSFLEMQRQSLRHPIPEDCAADIGKLLQQIYMSTRKFFIDLPESKGDELKDAEQSAEAFFTFLQLRRDRSQSAHSRRSK